MRPRITKDVFIEKARKLHGDKFDYSLITNKNYIDTQHKVPIICNACGNTFFQTPNSHMRGQGCNACACKKRNVGKIKKRNRFVRGIGINDYKGCVHDKDMQDIPSYKLWTRILARCYDTKRYHTYKDCGICDEWLRFSNFKRWFDENYIDGYHLDKDILVKGNKVYSPETCCFVPQEINKLIINAKKHRGELPVGVSRNAGKYAALVSYKSKFLYLGRYDTPQEAFSAYKQAKEMHIKEIANEYYSQGKITKRVYDALMNYKININD